MTAQHALSPIESAFLHVESERTPMHMASVAYFEGGPLQGPRGALRIEEIRHVIEGRLDRAPKLRQIARPGLLDQAPPVWSDDPYFDIAHHVVALHLTGTGDEADLRHLSGKILAEPLHRDRPLWELIFITGLSDGRVALIEKLHHSMADGIAAADLATVLLDLSPDPPATAALPRWRPDEPESFGQGALHDLGRLADLALRTAAWGVQGLLHPLRRATQGARVAGALATVARPQILAPPSSLNSDIGPRRSVDFVRLGFDQIHEIARFYGVTINDVLLTIVTGGLHQLLAGRAELTAATELQALVPVGLGTGSEREMANKVSAYFVRLPVAGDDPVSVLHTLSSRMQSNKDHHQELAAGVILPLLDPIPQQVLAKVVGLVHHQPFFNLIVTNVPGPPVPLYALGAKLLEVFPIVPLVGNQSLGIAAMSYGGHLNLGVFADPDACPDVAAFCAGAESTLQALVDTL